MFTLQAPGLLAELVDSGMSDNQANVLYNKLGNCSQLLEHRGPVNLFGTVTAPALLTGCWGVAQHNWEYSSTLPSAGGGLAWVWCKLASDSTGLTITGASEVKVYLPVPKSKDPNVVKDQVIHIHQVADAGNQIFISHGMSDSRVGTVVHDSSSTAPTGWALMDGSANSVPSGGTGYNASDRFLRMYDTSGNLGTTGGSETDTIGAHSAADVAARIADHAAAATTSSGGHDHTGDTGNTAEATHGTHDHDVGQTTIQEGTGTSRTVNNTTPTDPSTELSHAGHTHTISSDGAHTHNTPVLSHAAGTGTLSHDSVDTVPPYLMVAIIERLNNSRNITGV